MNNHYNNYVYSCSGDPCCRSIVHYLHSKADAACNSFYARAGKYGFASKKIPHLQGPLVSIPPPHPPLVACCCLTDILLRIYLWNGFWCERLLLRKEDCAKYCQICSSQVNLTERNALLVSVEEMYMFSLITCEHYVFVYF